MRPFLIFSALIFSTHVTFAAEVPSDASGGHEFLGKFRNTYYYIVLESIYAKDEKTEVIRKMDGSVLAQVSPRFKKAVNIEGTGRLQDGRVINYDGQAKGEIRYRVTQNVNGDGAGTCALIPFHTIAVDRTRIPLGSVVRIEETVGMRLPDGTTHDGLWRAEDVGGAIKADRIDLFVGDGDQGRVLSRHGITHLQALTIHLVQAPGKDGCASSVLGTENAQGEQ